MEYNIGEIVELKKPHPCGSNRWKITRIGVDFKFICMGCGHIITIQRPDAIKKIKRKID